MEKTELKNSQNKGSKFTLKDSNKLRKKGTIRLSKLKYDEKIVQIKRVTKVVKGGKKMTFRAVVIIGDSKQKVGVGVGRAEDVNLAIDKAVLNGKKNLINIPLYLYPILRAFVKTGNSSDSYPSALFVKH
jgi:small subunit ribosomal protein S5